MDNLLRHNIRNDLNVILGNASLIEESVREAEERTAVIRRTGERLLSSAEKEREIIDLLTSDVNQSRTDLRDVIETSVETVRDRFTDAAITASCPDGVQVCALDQLSLAIVELCENAISHSRSDQPTVDISVRSEQETVAVVIEDDAPSIPDVEAKVLTGDHDMTDVYHSSGMGLWLVYWIVELSDGDIEVESRDDRGNRIRITLSGGPA